MLMKKYVSKKYGFTLAETLITLAIIGICAAMVIPSLSNLNGHTSATEISVRAEKTLTGFTNAASQIIMNHTKTKKLNDVRKEDGTTICSTADCMFNMFGKYLQITKELTAAEIPDGTSFPGTKYGILSDGTIFGLTFTGGKCEGSLKGITTLPDSKPVDVKNLCGYIYYDANGIKNPNVLGKDRFVMPIYKTGIKLKSVTATK